MAAPPRFESLPSEIRNMIYSYLLLPAQLEKKDVKPCFRAFWKQQYLARVLPESNSAIVRTNRNINQEASAFFYNNILLVSIDWNTNENAYLQYGKMPPNITFKFVRPGAPLPPRVVHVQQNYHNENNTAARVSTIVAAADFPAICRLMLDPRLDYMDGARTSYSVLSLPKMRYNVEKLREMIWSPLLAIRGGRLGNLGGMKYRSARLIDCTGVFEQTAAALDWDPDSGDEDSIGQEVESDDGVSDEYNSETDTSGEIDDDEEEIYKEDTGERDNDEDNDEDDNDEDNSDEARCNENSDAEGSIDEKEATTDEEEHNCAEATTNKNRSKDTERMMSQGASLTSSRDGDANAQIIVKGSCVAGGQPKNKIDHKVPADIEANMHVDGIADKGGAEEH